MRPFGGFWSIVVVVVITMFGAYNAVASVADEYKTQLQNDGLVNVAIVIDWVMPFGKGTKPEANGLKPNMAAWLKKLMNEKWKFEAKETRMWLVTVGANRKIDEIDEKNSALQEMSNDMDQTKIEQWLEGAGGTYVEKNPAPKDAAEIVDQVRKKVFEKTGRQHMPNVTINVIVFPKTDTMNRGQWLSSIKAEYGGDLLNAAFHTADVTVLVSDWIDGSFMRAVCESVDICNDHATTNDAYEWASGPSKIRRVVEGQLHQCSFSKHEWSPCHYTSSSVNDDKNATVCQQRVKYEAYTDAGKPQYCVYGDVVEECETTRCEAMCEAGIAWSDCDCDTKLQRRNASADSNLTGIAQCANYQAPLRSCTPSARCPTPTPDPEAGYPVLAMPVWALLLSTLLVLIIVTVVFTLIIYFCCFPPPKEYNIHGDSVPATKRWHHRAHNRMHGTMQSFMQTFRGRPRGGGGGGTMTATVTERTMDRTARTDFISQSAAPSAAPSAYTTGTTVTEATRRPRRR